MDFSSLILITEEMAGLNKNKKTRYENIFNEA